MAEIASKNPIDKIKSESDAPLPQAKAAVAPRPVRHRRARLFQVYVALASIAFIALATLARFVNYFPIDLQITLAVQQIHNPAFNVLMQYLTILGFTPQVTLIWCLTALLLYVTGLKWEAAMTLFSVAGVSVLRAVVKLIVQRPRPEDGLVVVAQKISEFSFPSGHVLFYTGFVGFLWFLCYTLLKPGWRRTLGLWVFGLTIPLAGLSRVYLGEHWASDVLGSYLLGSAWLWFSVVVYNWGKPRFFVRQPVAPEAPGGNTRPSQAG
jgi:membrane-associated phospholipid phosphatase